MASNNKLKSEKKEHGFYLDLLLMLVPCATMAWYYYGSGIVVKMLVCMVLGILSECVGALLMKCEIKLSDASSAFTGAAMVLMLPADISLWIPVCGTLFAILAVKLPLGGTYSAPFVPTAAGFSFICLCWQKEVFTYPALGTGEEYVQGTSVAGMLSLNTSIRPNMINVFDILTGNMPGPAGAACIIVLLGTAAFLLYRHPRSAVNTGGFLLACALMALAFPRVYAQSERLTSIAMELCSGMLVFAAIFLVTDPATSPERPLYRFLYGAFTGILCMLLRYFGKFEESVCFALLVANASWQSVEGLLDRLLAPKKGAVKDAKGNTAKNKENITKAVNSENPVTEGGDANG